jgi:FKBP-type peptidyl-prolyl cis-trans isomerase 2
MEAADAYGEYDDSLLLEFPNDENAEGAEVGIQVQLSDGRIATIVEITDDIVTIDANHELAGQALTFEIEVLSIE